MILYNGASGGLGRYLGPAIAQAGGTSSALTARLEDRPGLVAGLGRIDPRGPVTFIHLAARVSVPACEADPSGAREINVIGARATVETVIDWASDRDIELRLVYVSSGHVYAALPDGVRASEDAPTGPRSVYAQTKLAAEEALGVLTRERGVPLLIARVFGLVAPEQPPNYVLPGLIERVREGRLAGIPGLDVTRDYLDGRDVCADLVALCGVPWPSAVTVVNVCSGRPVTIRDLLRAILAAGADGDAGALADTATAAPGRSDDIRWIVGDPGRFVQLTGREPQHIELAQTVRDAVAADRLAAQAARS